MGSSQTISDWDRPSFIVKIKLFITRGNITPIPKEATEEKEKENCITENKENQKKENQKNIKNETNNEATTRGE